MNRMEELMKTNFQLLYGRLDNLDKDVNELRKSLNVRTTTVGNKLVIPDYYERTEVRSLPLVPSTKFPSSLMTEAKLQLNTIFISWYCDCLYNCVCNWEEQHQLNKIAKVIAFLKRFLPNGTVITERPTTAELMITWALSISKLSNIAKSNAIQFLNDQKEQDSSRNCSTRKRQLTNSFVSVVKRITQINVEELPSPTVEDRATSEQYKDVSLITKKRQRRRLINNEKDVVNA
jgi:hypothetical protein